MTFNYGKNRWSGDEAPLTQVMCLKTGDTSTYTLSPIEALISAFIMATGQHHFVSDEPTRDHVRNLVTRSKSGQTAYIEAHGHELAVALRG